MINFTSNKLRTKAFLLLFLIIILSECNFNPNQTIVNFKQIKRWSLPLPRGVINSSQYLNTYPYSVKFIENNQQLLVKFYEIDTLYLFDLKSKNLINKIPLNHSFNFDGFNYINKDSILIFSSGVDKYYYDTAIIVIDINGKIKYSFGLNHKNIISSSYFNLSHLDEQTYFNQLFPYFISENPCINSKVYFVLNIDHNKFLSEPTTPVLGYYDFNKKKTIVYNDISYPVEKKIKVFNYPENITKTSLSLIPEKNEIWLSFSFSPIVYKINPETDEKQNINFACKWIDASSVFDKNATPEYNSFIYGRIFYIKSLNKYIRYISRRINDEFFYSIVTYDDKYNYIGEEFIDENKFFRFQAHDIYFNAEIENDSFIVKQLCPIEKKFNLKEFNRKLSKMPKPINKIETCNATQNTNKKQQNIQNYFKHKIENIQPSFAALILHEYGCSSCNEYFLKFLSLNNFLLLKKECPLYLVYITKKFELYKNQLNKQKIPKFSIDNPNAYNAYHPYKYFNPRLVLVKNNKIVSDTIYMPDNLDLLIERLLKFYNFEAK
ncbi:MAG: hypothetical protein HPY79_08880 [Bacteroidales bacterium]|nr:hypothetical protein [Bacteroidales bacterium]